MYRYGCGSRAPIHIPLAVWHPKNDNSYWSSCWDVIYYLWLWVLLVTSYDLTIAYDPACHKTVAVHTPSTTGGDTWLQWLILVTPGADPA